MHGGKEFEWSTRGARRAIAWCAAVCWHFCWQSGGERVKKYRVPEGNRLEARVGIEPTNEAFAEPCLTTWLPRLLHTRFDCIAARHRRIRFLHGFVKRGPSIALLFPAPASGPDSKSTVRGRFLALAPENSGLSFVAARRYKTGAMTCRSWPALSRRRADPCAGPA
jgi:hypothetical protein